MHSFRYSKILAQWLLALTAALLLASCGFQLRGTADLPFKSIYLGPDSNSAFAIELKRNIESNGVTVVYDKKDAEAILNVLADVRDKQVLTLNTSGQVREYALYQRYRFNITDNKGKVIIPTTAINLRRVITYDVNHALAKGYEETQLYRNMQSDLVQQILRRISAPGDAIAGETPTADD